jgi:hypothetical protein
LYTWRTSSNGGPDHYDLHERLLGQRWLRTFELDVLDLDTSPGTPSRAWRRQFRTVLDTTKRTFGEPFTGPEELLWTLPSWVQGLELDWVGEGPDQPARFAAPPTDLAEAIPQERLDALRTDCAMAVIARGLAQRKDERAVVQIPADALRDMLYPGGELFEHSFQVPEDMRANCDKLGWYYTWPGSLSLSRSIQFGRCEGSIQIRPESAEEARTSTLAIAPGLSRFTVNVRVHCRADVSKAARERVVRTWNVLRVVEYEDRIDSTYALDGTLVWEPETASVRGAKLAGTLSFEESVDTRGAFNETLDVTRVRGNFKLSGTIESIWSTEP